jgi:glycosyltransferase involved in cell wall biosynthesis
VTTYRTDLKAVVDYRRLSALLGNATVVHLVLAYPIGKYQLAAALMARIRRRRLIITHQLALDIATVRASRIRKAVWAGLFRCYSRMAAVHIASSHAGAELLTRHYAFPADRVLLIYNGADLRLFVPLADMQRLQARQAIAAAVRATGPWENILLVCTVARLNPQKGLFDLIDAAAEVLPNVPDARFLIVGDGELRGQLEERVARLGLSDTILFAGSRPLAQIATWLGATDLFVLPSHDEGLPLALLEAMAAGCPVVATAVGGVGEVVADESVGILVPPRQAQRLAVALRRLLDDGARRTAMGLAARERVTATFDVERCYAATIALYHRQARDPRQGPSRS